MFPNRKKIDGLIGCRREVRQSVGNDICSICLEAFLVDDLLHSLEKNGLCDELFVVIDVWKPPTSVASERVHKRDEVLLATTANDMRFLLPRVDELGQVSLGELLRGW